MAEAAQKSCLSRACWEFTLTISSDKDVISAKNSISLKRKNLDLEEKGNSILHQGNQNEAFPLGNVDEMLILVCCYNSGLVPVLWLNRSSSALSCDYSLLRGRYWA